MDARVTPAHDTQFLTLEYYTTTVSRLAARVTPV
jgi:hypothetical protein